MLCISQLAFGATGFKLCHNSWGDLGSNQKADSHREMWIQEWHLQVLILGSIPAGVKWGVPEGSEGILVSGEPLWPCLHVGWAHTHFELLPEDGALPQSRAVPAAVAELKLTLVEAHLWAFSYDDDGVRPALADRPLSGSQAWDLVTDDARAQSYHRGEATRAGDTERLSIRPAKRGSQPTAPPWAFCPDHLTQQLLAGVSQLFDTAPQPVFTHLRFHIGICSACMYNISEA